MNINQKRTWVNKKQPLADQKQTWVDQTKTYEERLIERQGVTFLGPWNLKSCLSEHTCVAPPLHFYSVCQRK